MIPNFWILRSFAVTSLPATSLPIPCVIRPFVISWGRETLPAADLSERLCHTFYDHRSTIKHHLVHISRLSWKSISPLYAVNFRSTVFKSLMTLLAYKVTALRKYQNEASSSKATPPCLLPPPCPPQLPWVASMERLQGKWAESQFVVHTEGGVADGVIVPPTKRMSIRETFRRTRSSTTAVQLLRSDDEKSLDASVCYFEPNVCILYENHRRMEVSVMFRPCRDCQ